MWRRVVSELIVRAPQTRMPRPAEVSDLAEGTPGRALWAHVFYFENRSQSMKSLKLLNGSYPNT